MKNFSTLLSFISLTVPTWLSAQNAEDDPKPYKIIEAEIVDVYVPQGFDSNDVPEFVTEVKIPDNQYRVLPPTVKIDEVTHKVKFDIKAIRYAEIGLPFEQLKMQPVKLPQPLAAENYTIWHEDEHLGPRGVLPIAATNSRKRDDYDYAPVEGAKLYRNTETGQRYVVVKGKLPDECYEFDMSYDEKFKDARTHTMKTTVNVIEVLPILKKNSKDCTGKKQDYELPIEIKKDVPPGRYLIHVRTADGDAWNGIENLF